MLDARPLVLIEVLCRGLSTVMSECPAFRVTVPAVLHCRQAAFRTVRTTICAGGTPAFLRSASPITRSAIGPAAHLRHAWAIGK